MNHYDITFRSVTYAQRGEAALRSAGIRCNLGRAPRDMEERGCGYRLRLSREDVYRALEVLRSKQIPFRKVYAFMSGSWEEVAL